jgi:hypothetical protein
MRAIARMVTLCIWAATSLVIAAESRQIENRQLTWADFKGEPEADSPYDAYTYWSVHYSYDAPTLDGDGFRVVVRVWNQLDSRSWVKPRVKADPSTAALLDHEQGHYTLGVLCALEFKKVASGRRFGKHYHAEIRDLFDQILKNYVDMEKRYDAETLHMRNPAAQQTWDRRLAQLVSERWADR